MSPDQQPTWQPISTLPLVASLIRGTLESAEGQHQSLLEARPTPHVLDDAIIDRLLKVWGETKEDLRLYDEQLARWREQAISPRQRQEVERLTADLARLRAALDAILALAEELQDGTIDKVLAKSDLQMGVEAVLGRPSRVERDEVNAALTAEQRETASLIDAKVQALTRQGADDLTLFTAMGDLMPRFKPLLDLAAARPGLLDKLCRQFPGLYAYAQILEAVAEGIRSGEIQVPG